MVEWRRGGAARSYVSPGKPSSRRQEHLLAVSYVHRFIAYLDKSCAALKFKRQLPCFIAQEFWRTGKDLSRKNTRGPGNAHAAAVSALPLKQFFYRRGSIATLPCARKKPATHQHVAHRSGVACVAWIPPRITADAVGAIAFDVKSLPAHIACVF
jgi:hypothetical protein